MRWRIARHIVQANIMMLDSTCTIVVAALKEYTFEIDAPVSDITEAVRALYIKKLGDIARDCRVVVDIITNQLKHH